MEGLGAWGSPEDRVQGCHSDCVLAPAPATCVLPTFPPGALCGSAGGSGKKDGLRTPSPSLNLLLALAPSRFHVTPGLPPELAEEPFQRGVMGPLALGLPATLPLAVHF